MLWDKGTENLSELKNFSLHLP